MTTLQKNYYDITLNLLLRLRDTNSLKSVHRILNNTPHWETNYRNVGDSPQTECMWTKTKHLKKPALADKVDHIIFMQYAGYSASLGYRTADQKIIAIFKSELNQFMQLIGTENPIENVHISIYQDKDHCVKAADIDKKLFSVIITSKEDYMNGLNIN